MKPANYLLLMTIPFFIVDCSAAKTTTENGNVTWQNSSEMKPAQTSSPAPTLETAAQTAAPDALIKDLYQTHDKDNGAIVQGKNRAILDKYFTKSLADAIWKDLTTNQNEVGVIDFDIFYNAQDTEIKNLAVGAAKVSGDKANVPVTFVNFKDKQTLNYSLVKENSAWKIADINYDSGGSLAKYFSDAKADNSKNSSPAGEFEGRYQIGETTCTVKPVKMAFEVKWEKGAGVEMFFFQDRANDRYIFASDPDSGKANSFVFDDENYDAGTFHRADGKEFPIERIR